MAEGSSNAVRESGGGWTRGGVAVIAILSVVLVALLAVGVWQALPTETDPDTGRVEAPVPLELAGLQRQALVTGPEAVAQTEQLHGKGLGRGLDEAWIAQYGRGDMTLWVSRSYEEADAEELLQRMTTSIGRSETPFTARGTLDRPQATVYELDGMGQRHYYFRVGTDLFWLAAPPASAEEALDDLLKTTTAESPA